MRISIFILLSFFFAKIAEARITIYACEPEWASLAREIAGNKAQILIATVAQENPVNVRVTNGVVSVIRTADLVFCTGGGLEQKWLKRAIEESNNVVVRSNPEALLLVYGDKVSDRKVLPRPHLNPHNILPIAQELTRRLKLLDAINANFYQKSYEKFSTKWENSIELWEKAASPIKGMRVVVSDDSWAELVKWLGLEIAAKIDTQKSYVANNQRLNEIVAELKNNPAQAIIFANYEDKKPILWLSEKTKTRIILLPFTIGGAANSADLFSLFSTTINSLLVDCSKSVCPKLKIEPEIKR
ncbi:MAG: zinc ABC transporter substrate-binding protein [Proteobacteria bacterium]|nr:zinc ABC transporter substrate-binding protein [Pseudomonadota bacterium]